MAGKILMQAGAKMTPSWLRLLEELHQGDSGFPRPRERFAGGGEQEMWRERLERALEEAERWAFRDFSSRRRRSTTSSRSVHLDGSLS